MTVRKQPSGAAGIGVGTQALDLDQSAKQTSRGRRQPVVEGLIEGGTVQWPPETLRRSRIFFLVTSSDQFS
jgi:hypothetical protein